MPGRSYRPAPPLADFVDRFWLWDDYTAPQPRERALPAGTVDLVINLREDAVRIYDGDAADAARCFPGALVCGAHSRYFVIDTAPRASVMGVHFRPGGAVPFLGVPAGDLCDVHASLEDLWGADARALRERLLDAMASLGAPWRFGTDAPEALLAPLGWDATVAEPGDVGTRWGRWPFPLAPRGVPGVPRGYLVDATRR